MTKIILLYAIYSLAFICSPIRSYELQSNPNTLRKFPYVMAPQPFLTRQARDVSETLNRQMMKGDSSEDGNQNILEPPVEHDHDQQSIQSNSMDSNMTPLPQQQILNYPYDIPNMHMHSNQIDHQNILQRMLDLEKVLAPAYEHQSGHHMQHSEQYQSNFMQNLQLQPPANQIPTLSIPPQSFHNLHSIYQNQQDQQPPSASFQQSQPTFIASNQVPARAPYPPKLDITPPAKLYLPSQMEVLPVTQAPLPSTTMRAAEPMMVNITPRPRSFQNYLPIVAPTTPRPTKSVITNIYSYDSPMDSEEDTSEEEPKSLEPQHYKILFIRAPNQLNKHALRRAHSQLQNQQKTVIYVLSKKTDAQEIRDALHYLPTTTSKPEVHFIKYKTEDEAEQAKHLIQNHYHTLSDSTQYSNEGTPRVVSAVGIAPMKEVDNSANGYLPPPPPNESSVSINLDNGYLPPAQ